MKKIIVMMLLLVGCSSYQQVTSEMIDKGNELCKVNNNLKNIRVVSVVGGLVTYIHCNNGAEFRLEWKDK